LTLKATGRASEYRTKYSYDQNGNLLSDGTRSFTYDDENQLTNVWVTNAWRSDFVYDGKMRRRIRREYTWSFGAWLQTNEVRYIYDGNLVIQERDANNLPTVSYTRGRDLSGTLQGAGGIGGLLARTDHALSTLNSPLSTAFYHADGNGNVTCLINTNQAIVAKYLYDPFGNILSKNGLLADLNVYRFSSKEWHQNSGLIYYQYRLYDPNLQRFPNPDPLGFGGGLNFYAYASGNPVSYLDPFGLDAWTSTFGVLRTIGGGLEAAAGYGLATAGAGLSATGIGATIGVPAIGLGVFVGAHGLDQVQAGVRQTVSGNPVDSFTSGDLQMLGVSRSGANLTDAGISVVGSFSAGAATSLIRATTIAATDPLAQGLSTSQILSQWESGSVALNNADYWGMGGDFTSPLYKAACMNSGAYPLTTTAMEGFWQSLKLAPTGLTPLGNLGAGVGGGTLGAVDWLGNSIQSSSTGKPH
jgi:RHS repeat-associated protein